MSSLKRYQVIMTLDVIVTTYAENREDAEDNFKYAGCMVAGNSATIINKNYDESEISQK